MIKEKTSLVNELREISEKNKDKKPSPLRKYSSNWVICPDSSEKNHIKDWLTEFGEFPMMVRRIAREGYRKAEIILRFGWGEVEEAELSEVSDLMERFLTKIGFGVRKQKKEINHEGGLNECGFHGLYLTIKLTW